MGLDDRRLTSLPLFAGIREQDLPAMLQCLGSYCKTYKKNEIIFLESHKIRSIGVVLDGTVHMIKEDMEGYQTLLVSIGEREVFGETFACGSLIDARVSFLAARDCNILFLPFHKVLHSCKQTCAFHHRLIENMVRLIGDKNVQLMDKITVVSKRTLRDKILAYLRLQQEEQGKSSFTIPLGRMELAAYLCADRSALTRELSAMQQDGLILYQKNTFHLL